MECGIRRYIEAVDPLRESSVILMGLPSRTLTHGSNRPHLGHMHR